MQIKLLMFDSNTWNHLTVYKSMSSNEIKNCYLQTIHLQIIYIYVCVCVCVYVCLCVYKQQFTLNNQ